MKLHFFYCLLLCTALFAQQKGTFTDTRDGKTYKNCIFYITSMQKKRHSDNFSSHLFWDVPKSSVDLDKYPQFIVKRVLEYGLLDDWFFIKNYYGIEKIAEIAKNLRELEPRALSYIAAVSKTPREKFRCYNYQQLNKTHLNS